VSGPLKLVPSKADNEEEDLVSRLKRLDTLVDELITEREEMKEEMEQVRLALGMDRYDFDRLRRDGIVGLTTADTVVATELNKLELKLRKELGYE
jgi:hypothetical protein